MAEAEGAEAGCGEYKEAEEGGDGKNVRDGEGEKRLKSSVEKRANLKQFAAMGACNLAYLRVKLCKKGDKQLVLKAPPEIWREQCSLLIWILEFDLISISFEVSPPSHPASLKFAAYHLSLVESFLFHHL